MSAAGAEEGEVHRGGPSRGALAELVARIALGDREACGALFDETSRLVHAIAFRILGSQDHADEVTLDVFVRVWRDAARFDPERGSVKTWLATIARGRALDRGRHLAVQTRYEAPLETSSEAVDAADPGPSPEAAPERSETAGTLRSALEKLVPQQRGAIELAFLKGLNHREISERLQMPLGSVKSNIRRGLIKLRAVLEPLAADL